MEQLLVAGLSKETVTAIMMLDQSIKYIGHTLDGDTDFFDVVTGQTLNEHEKFSLYRFTTLEKILSSVNIFPSHSAYKKTHSFLPHIDFIFAKQNLIFKKIKLITNHVNFISRIDLLFS